MHPPILCLFVNSCNPPHIQVLITFGFSSARFALDIASLASLALAFGIATFTLLKFGEVHIWDAFATRIQGRSSASDANTATQTRAGSDTLPSVASDLLQPLLPEQLGDEPNADDADVAIVDRGLVLEWRDMRCHLQVEWWKGNAKPKCILASVSGLAGAVDDDDAGDGMAAGSGLFGILGPSGAGKSTLLDILAGRQSRAYEVSGALYLDGAAASARDVSRVSGYVPQTDVLAGTSTVFEYLTFHAELRLPRSLSRAQRRARVYSVLNELGLMKVGNSFIGDAFRRGLSGGEQRRLSLAVELLSQPRLLFVDEATTGLDSTNAAKVVDILAGLSRRGVTCVLSIHQPRPDMFRLLTRVLVLSGDGAMVFSGPSHLADAHFGSLGHAPPAGVNIADFMLDTVLHATPEEVARMVDGFRSSEVQGANALLSERARLQLTYTAPSRPVMPATKYVASYSLQLRMLCGRLLRNAYRHPLLFWLQFGATLAVAVCLGVVFAHAGVDTPGIQDRLGSLFFMLLYLSFMALGSLPVWRDERLLFLHERAAGAYGTAAYFSAVVLFDILPLRVVPPLFFLLSYFMIGLRQGCWLCLVRFAGSLILSCVAASSLCMLIGILAPSNATANVIGSLILLSTALLGGFFVQATRLPRYLQLLSCFSPMRLAFDALSVNEFHGVAGFSFTSQVSPETRVAVTGDGILGTFGLSNSWRAFGDDLSMLAALVCILLTLCLICLART